MSNDSTTTLAQLKSTVAHFVRERDWNQFHNPKNLSMALSAEAAELLEKFLWCEASASFDELKKNRQEIEDECADVLIALIAFANACDIDLFAAFTHKLAITGKKYPVEKVKGRSDKYTKYIE